MDTATATVRVQYRTGAEAEATSRFDFDAEQRRVNASVNTNTNANANANVFLRTPVLVRAALTPRATHKATGQSDATLAPERQSNLIQPNPIRSDHNGLCLASAAAGSSDMRWHAANATAAPL